MENDERFNSLSDLTKPKSTTFLTQPRTIYWASLKMLLILIRQVDIFVVKNSRHILLLSEDK